MTRRGQIRQLIVSWHYLRVGVLKAIANEHSGCHRRSCAQLVRAMGEDAERSPVARAAHEQLAQSSLIAGDLLRSVRVAAATAF